MYFTPALTAVPNYLGLEPTHRILDSTSQNYSNVVMQEDKITLQKDNFKHG